MAPKSSEVLSAISNCCTNCCTHCCTFYHRLVKYVGPEKTAARSRFLAEVSGTIYSGRQTCG